MYKGGKCIYSADGGEVPIECGLVFTGAQYINTGITDVNGVRVVADVILDAVSGNVPLFACRNVANGFIFWESVGANTRDDYGSSQYTINRSSIPFNQRLLIDKNRNQTYVNGTLIRTHSAFTSPIYSNAPLWIGNVGVVGGAFYGGTRATVFSFKVYDVNDVLIRDLVPVPQGSAAYSSTPAPSNCMWDKVTQQYFENAGTGNFGIADT